MPRDGSIPDKEVLSEEELAEPDKCSDGKEDLLKMIAEEKFDDDSDQQFLEDLVTVSINFRLIVRDNGIGIKKEDQNKLFKHFGKLQDNHAPQQSKYGVGLGLMISRDLVKAFGGTIEIESEENKGTDFIINLSTNCKIPLKEYSRAMRRKVNFESLGHDIHNQRPGQSNYYGVPIRLANIDAEHSDTSSSSLINE